MEWSQADWAEIDALFDQAAALPKDQVDPFLESACQRPDLRRTVRELLNEEEIAQPSDFLRGLIEKDAGKVAEDEVPSEAAESRIGLRIGPYRIEREIGSGGMGDVFLASRADDAYQHQVALKIIRAGMATRGLLNRFKQERQILARLEHPNIVQMLDGGTTPDGLPYIAMAHVEGSPLTEYCDQHKLDAKARCSLMISICEAVDYAHSNLVVHRDIKPANILVTAGGVPKLLDFGIAKILDSESDHSETVTNVRPLTPDYASPEQLAGRPITTATDVYQLGAVLRRILTGQKPSDSETKSLQGDLAVIVRVAMHAEESRPYRSALQLPEDLRRCGENRPILARPDTVVYRMGKWIRRSPLAAGALAAVVLTAAAGIGSSLYQARRAERRFQQVRALAGTFVFEFDEQIKDLVGSTKAREFAVKTAVRYLDSLSLEAGNDASLLSELAAAYNNVGMIQGSPTMSNLGKSDEALASFDKSIRLSRQVLERDGSNREALKNLVHALGQKGSLLATSRRNTKEGGVVLREAQELGVRLGAYPSITEAELRSIMLANRFFADSLMDFPKQALPYHEKSLAQVEQLYQQTGKNEYRVASTGAIIGIARVQRNLGNTPEWVRGLEKAVAIVEPIYRAHPERESTRRQLWILYEDLTEAHGSVLSFHLDDTAKAMYYAGKAQEVVKSSTKLSDFEAAMEKTQILQKQLFLKTAQMPDLDEARAAAAELVRIDPKNGLAAAWKIIADIGSAYQYSRAGRHRLALPILLPLYERGTLAVAKNPDDLASLDRLGGVSAQLGKTYTSLGMWKEAWEILTNGEATAAGAVAKYPEDLFFLRNHALNLEAMGDYHAMRQDVPNAHASYGKALSVWTTWRKMAPWGPYAGLYITALEKKLASPKPFTLVIPEARR